MNVLSLVSLLLNIFAYLFDFGDGDAMPQALIYRGSFNNRVMISKVRKLRLILAPIKYDFCLTLYITYYVKKARNLYKTPTFRITPLCY